MLDILLVDTLLQGSGTRQPGQPGQLDQTGQPGQPGLSGLLRAAYARNDLPIKRLTVRYRLPAIGDGPADAMYRHNVLMASFTKPEAAYIEMAMRLRLRNESMFIVFVVDCHVDIAACVRPSVRPSGILFVPLKKAFIYQTVNEIYAEFLRAAGRVDRHMFTVRSEGEYFTVDTGDISFFEAQGKKIAIKTQGQEILFYSNYESVLSQLPAWFVRCHKGFVVNTRLIERVSFTEMSIKLRDKSVIPVSRTYRDALKSLVEPSGAAGIVQQARDAGKKVYGYGAV